MNTNIMYGILAMLAIASFIGAFLIKKVQRRQVFHELEVRFHKEANFFGEHGTLNASHHKQELKETNIRFVLVGLTTPPKLDLFTFVFLWEAAKEQGYIPHALVTYGKDNEIVNTLPVINDLTTDAVSVRTSLPVINADKVNELPNVKVPATAGPMSSVWTRDEKIKKVG